MLGSTAHSSIWRTSPGYVCLACRRAQARARRSHLHQIRWNSQQQHYAATDASADSWFETFNDISNDFGTEHKPRGKPQAKAQTTNSTPTTAISKFWRGVRSQEAEPFAKDGSSKAVLNKDGKSSAAAIEQNGKSSAAAIEQHGKSSAAAIEQHGKSSAAAHEQDGKSKTEATSQSHEETDAKATQKTSPRRRLDLNAKFNNLMGSLQSKIAGKETLDDSASNSPGQSVLETLIEDTQTRPPARARRSLSMNGKRTRDVQPKLSNRPLVRKHANGIPVKHYDPSSLLCISPRSTHRAAQVDPVLAEVNGAVEHGAKKATSAEPELSSYDPNNSSVAAASSTSSAMPSSFDVPQLQSLIDRLQTEAKAKAAEQDETLKANLASPSKISKEVDLMDAEPKPMPFFTATSEKYSSGRVPEVSRSEAARPNFPRSNQGGHSVAETVRVQRVLTGASGASGVTETIKPRPKQSSIIETTAQPSQAISQLLNMTKQSSPMRLVDRHRQHLQELVPFGTMSPKVDASAASFNSLRSADKITPQSIVNTATNDEPYGLTSQLKLAGNGKLVPEESFSAQSVVGLESAQIGAPAAESNVLAQRLDLQSTSPADRTATQAEQHTTAGAQDSADDPHQVAYAHLSKLHAELKSSPGVKKTPKAPEDKPTTPKRKTRRERLQKAPVQKNPFSRKQDNIGTSSSFGDQSDPYGKDAGLSIAEAMTASRGQSGGKQGTRTSPTAATSQTAGSDHEIEPMASDPSTEPEPSSSEVLNSLSPSDLVIEPLDLPKPHVPYLQYGLDRVLFNPGVYQLQDLESRVYNFDPYLQKIMPVMDFDFNALKEYKTSSQDVALSALAQEHSKKYIGSTSSMTSSLAHFHYLLSNWRPLNLTMLSKGFVGKSKNDAFTEINRAPSSIFLRWKNGTYAIDADKEYDSPNVLMLLGKSMELLLTLPKADFERYRKSDPRQVPEEERTAPEAYQYTTMGDFLMRSQLDASDPRLPGNGTFDLKTRAVVSVRMDSEEYETMSGYEIYQAQGQWGSYEREYYDMMRSTMLKYMLQARMGRMNGIFVAYHNVKRMFGFQYIPMADMDRALHGQKDACLGDQEFKASLGMLNKVLDKATAKFPEQSLRIHFETRPGESGGMPTALHAFAEPMTENEIENIQNSQKARIAAWERQILGKDEDVTAETDNDSISVPRDADVSNAIDLNASAELTIAETPTETSDIEAEQEQDLINVDSGNAIEVEPSATAEDDVSKYNTTKAVSSDGNADTVFLDSIRSSLKPLFHATIIAQSRVNGNNPRGGRAEDLKSTDKWEIDYILKEYETTNSQWALYEDCKARRKYAMNHKVEDEDRGDDEYALEEKKESGYIRFLRDMSAKGSQLRERIDELEVRDEVVRVDDHLSEHRENVGGVDDYMAWLYRK